MRFTKIITVFCLTTKIWDKRKGGGNSGEAGKTTSREQQALPRLSGNTSLLRARGARKQNSAVQRRQQLQMKKTINRQTDFDASTLS
jgi:hypothetical protein